MTDIVERLRQLAACVHADLSVGDEAADEIERLREDLRYYAKNHYPDPNAGPWGANSNDFGDVARAALVESNDAIFLRREQ